MTDRAKGLVVALEEDIRVDEIELECLTKAILLLRGVAGVEVVTFGVDDSINRMRIDMEWRKRIAELLR